MAQDIFLGEVELENVPIRTDALRFLSTTLVVQNGVVGRVKLKIPVSRLRSEPWSIVIEKVYVVVSSQSHDNYDELSEDAVEQEIKLAALDAIESNWRARQEAEPVDWRWMSYGTSLVATILENLQIQIYDVHMRYEDGDFSCGVSLHSLAAQSCDHNWIPKFVQRQPSDIFTFKLVELERLTLYVNQTGPSFGNLSKEELLAQMSSSQTNVVVGPINVTATFRRNCSDKPLHSRKSPRLACCMQLGEIELKVSAKQYQSAVSAGRRLIQKQTNRKFWRWRPHQSVKGHARLWWQYAITCHMEMIHEKSAASSWQTVLERARQNVSYVLAFQSYLLNPVTFPSDYKEVKDSIDSQRSLQELKILREQAVILLQASSANAIVAVPAPTPPGASNSNSSWFSFWSTGASVEGSDEEPGDEILEQLLVAPEDNALHYQDSVFMQADLSMSKCRIRLLGLAEEQLFELELTSTKVEIETRPREDSSRFMVSLDALTFRDDASKGSLYPTLISPTAAVQPLAPASKMGQIAQALQNLMFRGASTESRSLFHLLYERSPSAQIDHRLHIASQPLTVVYNPVAMRNLRSFFEISSEELRLDQIEEVKERTKARLRRNLLEWLEDNDVWRHKWELVLDLSAPQLIVPLRFDDKEAPVILVDFGKLHADNGHPPLLLKSNDPVLQNPDLSDEDESEEFITPASSPVRQESPQVQNLNLENSGLCKKIYETFSIQLSEMQVIVGHLKDNWRQAQLKGSSPLHFLDKFSINLQIDRRMVLSDDPLLPRFAISGTLPRLSIHLNEDKVGILVKATRLFQNMDTAVGTPSSSEEHNTEGQESAGSFLDNMDEADVFLLVYFCVTELSVELQSQGRSLVELQMTGAEASLSQRPCDVSVGFSVHSLLIVDAIQTLGPNFDLLAASHKSVTVDSVSGSLRGSDPGSPASPSSPACQVHKVTSPVDIARALTMLQQKKVSNPDSLISVEIIFVDRRRLDSEEERHLIASVHFNSLDVIANQETILELVLFLRRLMPLSSGLPQSPSNIAKSDFRPLDMRCEISAEFQRLNVLLLRAVTGRMIGTALATEANVHLQIANCISVTASLGGLQIHNLLPGSQLHQRILSVGRDPAAEDSRKLRPNMHTQLYSDFQHQSDSTSNELEALSCVAKYETSAVDVDLHMASVCYLHSPGFLAEVNSCASEFQHFLSQLATSLTSAATDLAQVIVQRNAIDCRLNAVLETPIIVLPRAPHSHQVLVAHLGLITAKSKRGQVSVSMERMNVFTLDLLSQLRSFHKDNNVAAQDNLEAISLAKTLSTLQLYSCQTESANPLLHDTQIAISLQWQELEEPPAWALDIKVIDPLRISVQRHQYAQILETVSHFSSSTDSTSLNSASNSKANQQVESTSSALKGTLVVPQLVLVLSSEARALPLISLSLDEFQVRYCKSSTGDEASWEISLAAVKAEDLSCHEEDQNRVLVTSLADESGAEMSTLPGRSISCPSLWVEEEDFRPRKSSLPHQGQQPPMNLLPLRSWKAVKPREEPRLVQVRITDRKGQHRRIDVDFNVLDIRFNLPSWVIILDFFETNQRPREFQPAHSMHDEPANSNSQDLEVSVKSLSVVFCQSEHQLARATVADYHSNLSWRPDHSLLEGRLGKFLLVDLTKEGRLYAERFLSGHGKNDALTFRLFRYNVSSEAHNYDAALKLRMTSIIYVHTHRFYTELNAFWARFQQHREVLRQAHDIAPAPMMMPPPPPQSRSTRVRLDIEADAPLLLLPVSAASQRLLVVHLGFLTVHNDFKVVGGDATISSQNLRSALSTHLRNNRRRRRSSSRSSRRSHRTSGVRSPASNLSSRRRSFDEDLSALNCLIDVMNISLSSMDLQTGDRLSGFTENLGSKDIVVGSFVVRQHQASLLKQTCELQLDVERNLDKSFCHHIPDVSVRGSLSKVHAVIKPMTWRVVRGLLAFNLGENLDDVEMPAMSGHQPEPPPMLSLAKTTFYLHLGLTDVLLDLHQETSALARVNFLRSTLTCEIFNDGSKDIDLVSQGILLNDLRYEHLPTNKRPCVFSQILRPLESESADVLQAELHLRLTSDTNRITVLVNNMRLLGIFDWWLCLLDFVSQGPESQEQTEPDERSASPNLENNEAKTAIESEEPLYPSSGILSRRAPVVESRGPVFELKLNITDSDLIIISDPAVLDSVAVILRSTTVIAYRPDLVDRPLSCNVNNAQVFSCHLSNEEESALSIIDPVTVNLEIAGRPVPGMPSMGLSDVLVKNDDAYNSLGAYERSAEIQLQQLNVRLSYRDWLVFRKILDSIPSQAGTSNEPQLQQQLVTLGFSQEDCQKALEICENQLEEAALWLTRNCESDQAAKYFLQGSKISFTSLEIKLSGLSVCLIDDSRETDVPLFDLSLKRLHLRHDFEQVGEASATLSALYFSKDLSAWEPLVEPWRCAVGWRALPGRKLMISAEAEDIVNINLTSRLMDLLHGVRKQWSALIDDDVLAISSNLRGSSRRRTPFTPFAIKNETGVTLWYRRLTKGSHAIAHLGQWERVLDGEELHFSFAAGGPQVNARSHQLAIRLDGWHQVTPAVTIDRVGSYYRMALPVESLEMLPPARVMCRVAIKGAALKLVTVRSALHLVNQLPHSMGLTFENNTVRPFSITHEILEAGRDMPVPLKLVWAKIRAFPLLDMSGRREWKDSQRPIEWYHLVGERGDFSLHSCDSFQEGQDIKPYRYLIM